jgi:hypothetical protein
VKKKAKKNNKIKPILEGAEEIGFGEKNVAVEDLSDDGAVMECVSEGEFDEEGVVDRVRLF